MRVLVTGGAGFLGSHLCRALLGRGDSVVCVDNFSTGRQSNVKDLASSGAFALVHADICKKPTVTGTIDAIAHMACPASPMDYLGMPLETLAIGSYGSEFVLNLAREHSCRVLLASTSEVYGDPLQRPQPESYWGNVNPVGPRSVYDESKRYAEAIFSAYRRTFNTNTGIVRIFNTYGPGLRPNDGRVVSNFIAQALSGSPLTIYGNGLQTRSFCYVSDLVAGLIHMLDAVAPGPVNLGNPNEITVQELAHMVLELTGSHSTIVARPAPADDPTTRNPNISLAREILGWAPSVSLEDGLRQTIDWQRSVSIAEQTRRLIPDRSIT